MTDKVQKIREEIKMVVNRRLNLLNGDYFNLIKETDSFTNEIMDTIDSLQEEYNITGIGVREKVTGTLREMLDKKELKKKCMYSNDNYTNGDRQVLCDGCEEECKYNKKEPSIPDIVDEHFDEMLGEEPVSEDFGEYINELSKQFPEVSFAKLSRIAVRVAKWQKEQMMANAVDGKVIANGMGNPILHLWDKGKHLIDKKVKVIIIKED